MTKKIGRSRFGTTLILSLLLVIVSVAAGAGLVYLIWNPTQPDEPAVVEGIQRLNELATVKYTTQVLVTEEENAEIFRQPLPEFLTGKRSSSWRWARSRPVSIWTSSGQKTYGSRETRST